MNLEADTTLRALGFKSIVDLALLTSCLEKKESVDDEENIEGVTKRIKKLC